MPTLDIDGARLAYDIEGTGERTLAFVHGWCSKAAHWDAQAAVFSSSYRILRWDRRGMGRSSGGAPAGSPDRHADDLAAILDAEGIDQVTVVGHAGGGPSAVNFAARYGSGVSGRAAGLVLVDTRVHATPPSGQADPWAESLTRSCARLQADGPPFFERLYRSFFGPRAPEAVVADAVANALATPIPVAIAEMTHMAADGAALAAQITCPVLWVSAQPDDTATVRDRFPNTQVTIGHVVGSGHFVQVEVPDQLNPMIAAFLDMTVGRS